MITVVVGCRPNFMKAAPLVRELRALGRAVRVIHTGQHYDDEMSKAFLQELDLNIDVNLGAIQTGSRSQRFAEMVRGCSRHIEGSECCVVIGDVDSTLAAAVSAKMSGVKLVHLEAGLRSFDRSMPEEVNRCAVDEMSDLLLCSEPSGLKNLSHMSDDRVSLVGNTLIDSLDACLRKLSRERWTGDSYAVATFHRPGLLDSDDDLDDLLVALDGINFQILLPAHPALTNRIKDKLVPPNVMLLDPQPHSSFIHMLRDAEFVITDSGGVQEETSYMGVPCLTYRENTERPITLQYGTNRLIGIDPEELVWRAARAGECLDFPSIPFWDGHASERAAKVITDFLEASCES